MPEPTAHRPLALVTGAAGGIGQEVGRRLVRQGFTVLCAERDQILAEKAAAVHGAFGLPVVCDLADRDAVRELAGRVTGEWADDLTLVFLNAGVIVPGDVADLAADVLRLHLEVNLAAVMELSAASARAFRERGRGHLVATVSMGGILALPGSAAYSATKAGLRAFLAALRCELRGTGVAVSGIYPSAVDTPMLLHEATHGGSVLNFFGAVHGVEKVADVFEKAQRRRRLEHYLPYSDAVLTRLLQCFPWLVPPMLRPAEAIGRIGRRKYLARKGITAA